MAHADVLVTGSAWIGENRRSTLSGLVELLRSARREILGTVYSLAGFPDEVLGELGRALGRGVTVRVVIQRFAGQSATGRRRLLELGGLGELWLYSFEDDVSDLHAKVWLADRHRYLVGSANLSRRGFRSSHELALGGDDPATGESIGSAIDALLRSSAVHAVHRPTASSGASGSDNRRARGRGC